HRARGKHSTERCSSGLVLAPNPHRPCLAAAPADWSRSVCPSANPHVRGYWTSAVVITCHRRKPMRSRSLLAARFAVLALAEISADSNWPQFRGTQAGVAAFFTCHDARTGKEIYGRQRISGEATGFSASPWGLQRKDLRDERGR